MRFKQYYQRGLEMTDKPEHPRDPIPSELAQEDESFIDLVEEFVEGLGDRVEKIRAAVISGDLSQLRTLAHQLKGSAGGYGYPIITEKAAELEQHATAEELEASKNAVEALQTLVSRVVIRLD